MDDHRYGQELVAILQRQAYLHGTALGMAIAAVVAGLINLIAHGPGWVALTVLPFPALAVVTVVVSDAWANRRRAELRDRAERGR